MTNKVFCKHFGTLVAFGILGATLPALASPFPSAPSPKSLPSIVQQGRDQRGGAGSQQRGGGGGQQRGSQPSRPASPAQSRPVPTPPVQHARRDVVRTNNYVPRPGAAPVPPVRNERNAPSRLPNPPIERQGQPTHVFVQRQFTKTPQGRQYDNGLHLRKGVPVAATWERRYFPHGYAHFPYYRQNYARGQAYYSPFGFYFGICLPYISASYVRYYPPSVMFIDAPLYDGVRWSGWNNDQDRNWLNDRNLDDEEPGLNNALDELTEAYQSGNIDGLVALVDPGVSVAVYERGAYQYTMPSNDFLDLTRDALRSLQTVSFNLEFLHQRATNIFSVGGQHIYRSANGQVRTVYVNFVLQDFGGHWTITQVETSPDVVQNL